MQIFEITQSKRIDEGVLGALGSFAKGVGKSLANKFVGSTLPGVTAFDEPDKSAAPATTPAATQAATPTTTAAQVTAPVQTPQPTAQSTAPVQTTTPATTTAAPTQPSWVGTNINVPAVQRKKAAQTTAAPTQATQPTANVSVPAVQRKPAATVPAPAATTAPADTGVVPQAGHRIVVQAANGGKYYKTEKGWSNELGQAVTNSGSIATLEKLADVSGKEERIPAAKPVRPVNRPVAKRKRR